MQQQLGLRLSLSRAVHRPLPEADIGPAQGGGRGSGYTMLHRRYIRGPREQLQCGDARLRRDTTLLHVFLIVISGAAPDDVEPEGGGSSVARCFRGVRRLGRGLAGRDRIEIKLHDLFLRNRSSSPRNPTLADKVQKIKQNQKAAGRRKRSPPEAIRSIREKTTEEEEGEEDEDVRYNQSGTYVITILSVFMIPI